MVLDVTSAYRTVWPSRRVWRFCWYVCRLKCSEKSCSWSVYNCRSPSPRSCAFSPAQRTLKPPARVCKTPLDPSTCPFNQCRNLSRCSWDKHHHKSLHQSALCSQQIKEHQTIKVMSSIRNHNEQVLVSPAEQNTLCFSLKWSTEWEMLCRCHDVQQVTCLAYDYNYYS